MATPHPDHRPARVTRTGTRDPNGLDASDCRVGVAEVLRLLVRDRPERESPRIGGSGAGAENEREYGHDATHACRLYATDTVIVTSGEAPDGYEPISRPSYLFETAWNGNPFVGPSSSTLTTAVTVPEGTWPKNALLDLPATRCASGRAGVGG